MMQDFENDLVEAKTVSLHEQDSAPVEAEIPAGGRVADTAVPLTLWQRLSRHLNLPPLSEIKFPTQDLITIAVLAALVVVGYALRATGRNWDDYTKLHPDERFLTTVVSDLKKSATFTDSESNSFEVTEDELNALNQNVELLRFRIAFGDFLSAIDVEQSCDREGDHYLCRVSAQQAQAIHVVRCNTNEDINQVPDPGGYFDAACSPLNPNNLSHGIYVYGQYPLFSVRALAESYDEITDRSSPYSWTSYVQVSLVGRAMNSVFDTLSILLVFLIGSRLLGRAIGFLAAGFYTFAAFAIQQSHFWTVDAFTAFWVLLAIYFAVRVMDGADERRDRFQPLLWIVVALVVWIWDVSGDFYRTDHFAPLLVYLVLMGAASFIVMWMRELEYEAFGKWAAFIGGAIGLVVLVVLAITEVLSPVGALLITLAVVGLGALSLSDMTQLFSYTRIIPVLAAAYGMWVYDALAHYETASIVPLAVYLIIFALVMLIVSILRQVQDQVLKTLLFLILSSGLLGWCFLAVEYFDLVSREGVAAALGLGVLIGLTGTLGLMDFAGFGIAFGMALAGRVNTAPLVGVVFLAILIRGLVLLDKRVAVFERTRIFGELALGLIFAGILTIFIFRFLQPHALLGPTLLSYEINPAWQDDISDAGFMTSGQWDAPPNHQWVKRIPWLFPGQNIVLYGLGPALGLVAVAGFSWSLLNIIRGKPKWTRLAIPVAWVLVYFGWLGGRWVTTMRYFLPIYGMLCIFAAWLLWRLVVTAWRRYRASPRQTGRRLALGFSAGMLIFVAVYTALYGYGITSIYRHQLTRVAASRYFHEQVPATVGLWVEHADGQADLLNVPRIAFVGADVPAITPFQTGESLTFRLNPPRPSQLMSVVLHRLGDPDRDSDVERVQIRIWSNDTFEGRLLLAERILEQDLAASAEPYGTEYSLAFDPHIPIEADPVNNARTYEVEVRVLSGGPVTMSRNVYGGTLPVNFDDLSVYYRDAATEQLRIEGVSYTVDFPRHIAPVFYITPARPLSFAFTPKVDGEIRYLDIPNLSDPTGDSSDDTLNVRLIAKKVMAAPTTLEEAAPQGDGQTEAQVIVEEVEYETTGVVAADFNVARDGLRTYGTATRIELATPFRVVKGKIYTVELTSDQVLGITGTIVATDGAWDDDIPYKVCPLDPTLTFEPDIKSGLCDVRSVGVDSWTDYYKGIQLPMLYEDVPDKRREMLQILNHTNYITISSNRFYDSYSRTPRRWPMSNRYYEALFSGELGFELVETFESYARVGPLVWKDQILPTDDLPGWMNEFEAEEAFHVYDHPTVFVFRKTEDYSADKAAAILGISLRTLDSVIGGFAVDSEPVNVFLNWGGVQASVSPTGLQFDSETRRSQQEGGTWRDIFDRASIVNRNQVAAVILWWLLMIAVGWSTFPLLFVMFPALPDRGFGAAKLVGWLLVAWVAWVGSAFQLSLWTQSSLIALLAALAALSVGLIYRRRGAFFAFLRHQWRHLVFVEAIALALYLLFIGIRLGNPDLWHFTFGGEKPMNFAYLNATLRSTSFPPLDPWFAGGYINYYYWGYVLVGAPIKVLGVVPSLAYNLALPTVFSMTGIGAFTVTYNLAEWNRQRRLARRQAETKDAIASGWKEALAPAANPYLAGLLTILLAVLIGNLDTPRVFVNAIGQVGSNQLRAELEQEAYNRLDQEFYAVNGRLPTEDEKTIMRIQAQESAADEQISRYEEIEEGFGLMLEGRPFSLPTHRWYWAPTRVIAELTEVRDGQVIDRGHGAITEMPFFTFLYGDLHAHMIAMPMTLFVILFLLAEVLGAGQGLRTPFESGLALFIGATTVGLLKATNTWDWPTYLVLGMAGLTFAAWVGQGRVQAATSGKLYERFKRFLDLRYAWQLFPLLLVIPAGMLIRSLLYLVQTRAYEQKDANGEIPLLCKQINLDLIRARDIPPECKGLFEPQLTTGSLLMWGLGAFIAVLVIYTIGLIVLGNRLNRLSLLSWTGRIAAFVAIGGVPALSIVPFEYWFASDNAEIYAWDLDKTPLWAYLNIHGLFIFILIGLLLWQTVRWLQNHRVDELRRLGVPFILVVLALPVTFAGALFIGMDYPVYRLALPLLVWIGILFLLPGQSAGERFIYLLAGLALAISMGVEYFAFTIDNGRQNSVFKFYIQVWLLFSLVGGMGLAWLLKAAEKWNAGLRGMWQAGLTILLGVSLLYPVLATQARFLDRFNATETPLTLDGMEYMQYAPHWEVPGIWYNLSGDYRMIRWLQDNLEGTPTIIEAQLSEYRWGSRISIYTGLPTVMGWRNHQSQQRNVSVGSNNLNTILWNRLNNVQAFYETTDIATAWSLIEFYQIKYIIVGTLERMQYRDVIDVPGVGLSRDQSAGIAKFDRMASEEFGMLELVYSNNVCLDRTIRDVAACPSDRIVTDKIYRVRGDYRAESSVALTE